MSRIPGESKTTGRSNSQMSTPKMFYRCVGSFAFLNAGHFHGAFSRDASTMDMFTWSEGK